MIAYQDKVSAEFTEKVIQIANRLGIDPSWLMIVMRFESANTFSPTVKNKYSGAIGLIQFVDKTAKALGTTLDKLAAMTAVQQLDYVEKYLTPYKGKMTDLYNTYLAVFSPAYIGRPDAQVVYKSPSNAYTGNKELDTNGDGIITVYEIKSVISRYIPAGFTAGSLTTDQKTIPAALILVVIILLYFILKRPS